MIRKLYFLLEGDNKFSRALNTSITVLIIMNILLIVLSSFEGINNQAGNLFNLMETVSVIIFTIEYVMRVMASGYRNSEKFSIKDMLKYIISPMALIDLFSIIPFYLPLLFAFDLRVLRIFRLFRLIRILKIKRVSNALDLITNVLKSRRSELILTFTAILIMVTLCGSLMYYAENDAQPEIFPNIVEATFWSLKTMVFLGYDVSPLTDFGKLLGILITMLGLGWIALPISIISSGFIEEINKKKRSSTTSKTETEV